MNDRISSIDHTIEILKKFDLELIDDEFINDVKIIHQTPAIAIIGLVSRGKSTLVNKLIGSELLPTGPNPVTFGNGFLKSGQPQAVGILASGARIDLPVDPEQFQFRARRYDAQDIVDFEYTGVLRIPKDTMLIDTKGLDEIASQFDDDLVELERSWASQGAMAALLVTSVPPGMSAQDAHLFRSLRSHFNGNVLVVVKQTDSSLANEEVQEAANVWVGHGADVVTIPDQSPLNSDTWGTGPLEKLEKRLSKIWSNSSEMKEAALKRTVKALEDLARSIEIPASDSTIDELNRRLIWASISDVLVLHEVQEHLRHLLHEYYIHSGSTPQTVSEFEHSVRYAAIGSVAAIEHLRMALRTKSALKTVIPTGQLIEILASELPLHAEEIFRGVGISSNAEFTQVSRAIDLLHSRGFNGSTLSEVCLDYVSSISDEAQILQMMNDGGEILAPRMLPRLLMIWNDHISNSTSRLSWLRDAEATLATKIQISELRTTEIKSGISKIYERLLEVSLAWGTKETTSLEFEPSRSFVVVESYQSGVKKNPFIALEAKGDRVLEVLNRLSNFTHSYDENLMKLHNRCVSDLNAQSTRQIWARRMNTLTEHNIHRKYTWRDSYQWLAVLSALSLLFAIGKNLGLSIFFGSSGLYFLGMWFISHRVDPVKISEFTDNELVPGLRTQIRRKISSQLAIIAALAMLSGIIQIAITIGSDTKDVAEQSVPIKAQTATSSTTPINKSTTPLATTATLSISQPDLLHDEIQNERGIEIFEISRLSDFENQISYVFTLSKNWSNLPNQIRGKYCWVSQDRGGTYCGYDTAIRFEQVTKSVVYSILTDFPTNIPTGKYKLDVELSGMSDSFMSSRVIEVTEDVMGNSSVTSLPYLTKRNRHGNANCPKIWPRNESLPIKLCQKGNGVKRIQFLLGIGPDGYFGNTTHNALLDFQFAQGLTPTGIVDRQTWYELDRAQGGPGMDYNSDGLVTPDEFR